MEVGSQDVQGLPLLAQPAPRQSYAPMAGKPVPTSHKPSRQWNQAPVILIYHCKNKGGRKGGKRMFQRLNVESGHRENALLSTWRWCKQGWPHLSQMTDRWARPHSLLLTMLKKYFINLNFSQIILLLLLFSKTCEFWSSKANSHFVLHYCHQSS